MLEDSCVYSSVPAEACQFMLPYQQKS